MQKKEEEEYSQLFIYKLSFEENTFLAFMLAKVLGIKPYLFFLLNRKLKI